jgi:hypothetical protein
MHCRYLPLTEDTDSFRVVHAVLILRLLLILSEVSALLPSRSSVLTNRSHFLLGESNTLCRNVNMTHVDPLQANPIMSIKCLAGFIELKLHFHSHTDYTFSLYRVAGY